MYYNVIPTVVIGMIDDIVNTLGVLYHPTHIRMYKIDPKPRLRNYFCLRSWLCTGLG